MTQKKFLKIQGTKIVAPQGHPVILKGVNLGGWLMMEGYILHSLNFAEQLFKKNFAKNLGNAALGDFEKNFRDNFIQEDDFRKIANFGFNCIRLPFNSRLVEKAPYRYSQEGVSYLDRALQWGQKHGLWIILDLHAAVGAQNHDWHSDSLGKAELWQRKDFQSRTLALWQFLADRYKNNATVAGYDLLNEAVTDDVKALNRFYKRLIKAIRDVDKNHILFIEGNTWAMDLDCLEEFDDDQAALSIHAYQPLDLTFNFIPYLRYPLRHQGKRWDKNALKELLSRYNKIAKKRLVPIYVGEFGVNARQGRYGEDRWLGDMLACFREFGFHWTYWTYKAIKNSIFPDGILSFRNNPPWVNRQGPLLGWDTYSRNWPKRKNEMVASWRSEHFVFNTEILNPLRHAAK